MASTKQALRAGTARTAPRHALLQRPLGRKFLAICAAIKNPNSPSVVTLQARHKVSTPVTTRHDAGCKLDDYMGCLRYFLTSLELPLGAKLERAKESGPDRFLLTVPRLQIMDFYVQPCAEVALVRRGNMVQLTSNHATVRGSQLVEELERQGVLTADLDVTVTFSWDPLALATNPKIDANAQLMIKVDLPMPFSLLPKPVVEAAGNTALGTMAPIMMNVFTASMARDYELWANNLSVRTQREQLVMSY